MTSEIKFGSLLDSIPKDKEGENHFLATGKSTTSSPPLRTLPDNDLGWHG
jgi:hypothetical protein